MGGVGCRLTERKMADEHVCECMRECVRVAQTRLSSLCVCVCVYIYHVRYSCGCGGGGHMSERGKRASSSEMRFNVSESCDDGAYDISFRVDETFLKK